MRQGCAVLLVGTCLQTSFTINDKLQNALFEFARGNHHHYYIGTVKQIYDSACLNCPPNFKLRWMPCKYDRQWNLQSMVLDSEASSFWQLGSQRKSKNGPVFVRSVVCIVLIKEPPPRAFDIHFDILWVRAVTLIILNDESA